MIKWLVYIGVFSALTAIGCSAPDGSSYVSSADPSRGIETSYASHAVQLRLSSVRAGEQVISTIRDGTGQELTRVSFRSDFTTPTLTDAEYERALTYAQQNQNLRGRLDDQPAMEALLASYQDALGNLKQSLPATMQTSVFTFALQLHIGLLRKVAVQRHAQYRPVIASLAGASLATKARKPANASLLEDDDPTWEGGGGWDDPSDPGLIDQTEDWDGGWGDDDDPSCDNDDASCNYDDASCDRSQCYTGMCGEDHGCCGNYSGCCLYTHPVCDWHDEACACCDHWYCGWSCKPDRGC